MPARNKPKGPDRPNRPPATTPEARENQMVSLAFDLAERQMREGTASAQVITHYLKLATQKELLERDKIRAENRLLEARVKGMESAEKVEVLYAEAIKAFKKYSGDETVEN